MSIFVASRLLNGRRRTREQPNSHDSEGDSVVSGPSEKTQAPTPTESLDAASLGAQAQSPTKPVRIWAVIGGAILVFQLYVWIRWISGPYFERVPAGPSDPPTLMK